jgi:hypothetical protein
MTGRRRNESLGNKARADAPPNSWQAIDDSAMPPPQQQILEMDRGFGECVTAGESAGERLWSPGIQLENAKPAHIGR